MPRPRTPVALLALTLLGLALALAPGCGDPSPPPRDAAALPDGVYEVLAVAPTPAELPAGGPDSRVLPFDHAYLQGGAELPPEHVLLRTIDAAPLDLAEAPSEGAMGGRPVLLLTLEAEAGAALERLTAKAKRAAVVVDGRIVTVHRIRVPIEGGRLQVSC